MPYNGQIAAEYPSERLVDGVYTERNVIPSKVWGAVAEDDGET
jgi:hypothetical protein